MIIEQMIYSTGIILQYHGVLHLFIRFLFINNKLIKSHYSFVLVRTL